MTNPNKAIVTSKDYLNIIGMPTEKQKNKEVINRLNKWLIQATEQIDSMISTENDFNKLYKWFNKLDDTDKEDLARKYKIKKAICLWVETFILTGKIWADGVPTINSNINIDISASSENSNIEAKRKDIIQDLVSLGLYRTTNILDSSSNGVLNKDEIKKITDLVILNMRELDDTYVAINPKRAMQGSLDFNNNIIKNTGDINAHITSINNKNRLRHFELENCLIDGDKNKLINLNNLSVENAKKIWDPIDQIYKMINDFDVNYFDGLTKEQTYEAIHFSGISWSANLTYRKGFIVRDTNAKNELEWFRAKIDNQSKKPSLNPNYWEQLLTPYVDMNVIIDQLKPYIDLIVDGRIDNALDQRKRQFIQETQGQILVFRDQADYEAFRDANNLVDNDFEDEPNPVKPLPPNIAYTDRNNTFTGNNSFNRPLNIVEAQNNNQAVTKNYADQIKTIATNKQDRISAGNGISISNNTITNTLYGKTLKIVEKHIEIFKQTFTLNTGKPKRQKLFNWKPQSGSSNAQGYLFYIRLENRNNNAVNSSIQFRQTHLNDVDYYNVVKMPINDGVGSSFRANGYVKIPDFIPFSISDDEVWILDSDADIFGGTLKFIIYEISQEVELR